MKELYIPVLKDFSGETAMGFACDSIDGARKKYGTGLVGFIRFDPETKNTSFVKAPRARGWYKVKFLRLPDDKSTRMLWSDGETDFWYNSIWFNCDGKEYGKSFATSTVEIVDAVWFGE